MYISMQSRGFAQILLQQQKITNKECNDDNELQPSFSVPATPLKLVHYWRLCSCNYYQRAQKWNNAPVWGIMLNDFLLCVDPQDSRLLCFHIIQYKSERIIV